MSLNDWDWIAQQYGYRDERDLLTKLYVEEGRSINAIAMLTKSGSASISRRLEQLKIDKRSRGGDNNHAKQTSKLLRFDQRIVLSLPLKTLSTLTGLSRSLFYKYRRSRGEANGFLYIEPDRWAGALLDVVEPPFGITPDRQPKVSTVLPEEESGG